MGEGDSEGVRDLRRTGIRGTRRIGEGDLRRMTGDLRLQGDGDLRRLTGDGDL